MAVEDVFKPKTVKEVDPKVSKEKGQGDVDYWTRKAEEARARHDYVEAERAIQMINQQQPESPFKVTGEVSLGKFDFQEQTRHAQEQANKVLEDKDKELKSEREKSETLAQQLNNERVEALRNEFQRQMGDLTKMIEKMGTAQDTRPIWQQFKEMQSGLREMAESLGMEKTTSGLDPAVQLELKKLDLQQAKEQRDFELRMEQDKRNWDLKLMELKDTREYQKAQLQQQARKDDMIANFPNMIGGAIAKGILEQGQGGVSSPGGQQPSGQEKAYYVRFPEGQGGEVDCPHCHTAVGFGPTSTVAQCVGCNRQFPIQRVPAASAPPNSSEQEVPAGNYDEEGEE